MSPCGGSPPSDAAAISGRQVALIHPMLWKAERLVVYRDQAVARRALAERRAALARCTRHDDGGILARNLATQLWPVGGAAERLRRRDAPILPLRGEQPRT